MIARHWLAFTFFALAFAGCWTSRAHAQTPATQPAAAAAQQARVQAILAGIKEGDADTLTRAEAALVALGKPSLPALREAFTAAQGDGREALDAAITRLTWNVDVRQSLETWLRKNGPEIPGIHPVRVTEAVVLELFPNHRFFTLVFPQFPVAHVVAEPLAIQNIFAVSKTGAVEHLKAHGDLVQFFGKALPPAKTAVAAKQALAAWLVLVPTYEQDGRYRFSVPAEGLQIGKRQDGQPGFDARGKAVVAAVGGNHGWVESTMTFDSTGRLLTVETSSDLTKRAW
jgi:hypothetical protein